MRLTERRDKHTSIDYRSCRSECLGQGFVGDCLVYLANCVSGCSRMIQSAPAHISPELICSRYKTSSITISRVGLILDVQRSGPLDRQEMLSQRSGLRPQRASRLGCPARELTAHPMVLVCRLEHEPSESANNQGAADSTVAFPRQKIRGCNGSMSRAVP